MLSLFTKWRSPKSPPIYVEKSWRTGMWVMYQDKVAVIFKLGPLTEIHYTDPIMGENIGTALVPVSALRQARYPEIPQQRRNISAEKALELGYGP